MSTGNEFTLLKQRRFLPFFITQFLGAFNDNVFKNALVIMIAFQTVGLTDHDTNVLINLSAGLLILPGFLTDTLGLLLLVPPLRRLLIARLSKRVVVQGFATMAQPPRPSADPGQVIEGDFQEIDPKNPSIKGNSGWTRH